jgi:hypothetical protein
MSSFVVRPAAFRTQRSEIGWRQCSRGSAAAAAGGENLMGPGTLGGALNRLLDIGGVGNGPSSACQENERARAARPEPPEVFPNLDFPVFDDPAEGGSPGDDDDDSSFWDDLLDFVLSLVKVIVYIAQVAAWLASLPWAVLADLVTYPIRLGIYYALELPLWHLFKSVRSVLVMAGYLAPMDDEIASGLIRVGFPDPAAFADVKALMDDVFGGMRADAMEEGEETWRDPGYPRLNVKDEYRSPWLYPLRGPELPSGVLDRTKLATDPYRRHPITASPHGRGADVTALFGMVIGDPDIRDAFESAETPGHADAAGLDVSPTEHLGDAVSFSEYLIWLATRDRSAGDALQGNGNHDPPPLVDWNLDADRGYGYHCWDWNRSNKTGTDPEGIKYPLPCQPLSQDYDHFDETKPVLLHWYDEADPGCDLKDAGSVLLDPPNEE